MEKAIHPMDKLAILVHEGLTELRQDLAEFKEEISARCDAMDRTADVFDQTVQREINILKERQNSLEDFVSGHEVRLGHLEGRSII